jgi:hypothetical protein
MKRLHLVFLIIGASFIFFSCSKDNASLAPDINQSDELTTSLKGKKVHTHFDGECTPLFHPDWPEPNTWYDDTDDARVTGVTVWESDPPQPIDEITLELTGSAELFVGAETVGDDYDGKWEMTWHGTQTLTGSGFRIVAHAVGTGTDGNVLGLTCKWKYTMDYVGGFPLNPIHPSFKYVIKGKITEEL